MENLLSGGGKELKIELEQLLRGESIEKAIDENIVLRDIYLRDNLLWSFLPMGGYLKQTGKRRGAAAGKMLYNLCIPNLEVRDTYTRIIRHYFSSKILKNWLWFLKERTSQSKKAKDFLFACPFHLPFKKVRALL